MSIDKITFRKFEEEIWLYLDKDLPEEKMQFWAKLIEQNEELKKEIKSIKLASNFYNETIDYNLDDLTFNKIINQTINKKSLLLKGKDYFSKLLNRDDENLFGKVAFASLLIVFAVIASLTSSNPNPTKTLVKTVKSEILDWDAKLLDNQINKIEALLLFVKNDDYKKYRISKITSNKWDKNTFEIGDKIEKIKSDLGNNEF